MTIDFVLPWVNPLDKKWQESKAYNERINSLNDQNEIGTEYHSSARYRDIEILKYVLRSIEYNCPWYGTIHIITEGHTPDWLDLNNDKVNIITHQQLYSNAAHLPTFNSSSIEANLHNIQGVSDKFIYLNDDTMIIQPLNEDRFFVDGKPVDFLQHGWFPRGRLYSKYRSSSAWVSSLNNCMDLINSDNKVKNIPSNALFNSNYSLSGNLRNLLFKYLWRKLRWVEHWHHPQPYLLTSMNEVNIKYADALKLCSQNKFRSHNDITQYLYRYYRLIKGEFEPHFHNDGLVANIECENDFEKTVQDVQMRRMSKSPIRFLCLNDSRLLSDSDFHKIKISIRDYLTELLPNKASFEN